MLEHKEFKNFVILNDLKNYGTWVDIERFLVFLEQCIERIKESNDPREIIMETWFGLDYLIRDLLLKAFNITEYSFMECDLQYKYLPQSFDSCLQNLLAIRKTQGDIKNKYDFKEDYLKYPDISVPGSFVIFLEEKHEKFLKKFLEIQNEYYREYEPAYYEKFILNNDGKIDNISSDKPRKTVSAGWLKCTNDIDDGWVRDVRTLNRVRNFAAHCYDKEKIYENYGCNGSNRMKILKSKCFILIEKAMGIKIKE